jgi:hypothetical protein
MVLWESRKQPIVTLSSVEGEYITTTRDSCQELWMKRMLKYLLQEQLELALVFCENNSAIMLSNNQLFQKKTKNIDTRYHFIRELVNNKEICLNFCRSKEQVAEFKRIPKTCHNKIEVKQGR